jgi:hypothetical protein
MNRFYVSCAGLTAGVTFCVVTSGCGGPSNNVNPSVALSDREARPARQLGVLSDGHIYVTDLAALKVFRFPIVKGVVSTKPDGTLKIAPPSSGVGVPLLGYPAIDPSGNIAVPVYNDTLTAIETFAPMAVRPMRTLVMSGFGPSVQFDSASNIYVNLNGLSVFPPGAAGMQAPTVTYPILDGTQVVLSGGKAYGNSPESIVTYSTPLTAPTPGATYCLPAKSSMTMDSIAVDQKNNILYASQHLVTSDKNNRSRIAIYSLGVSSCPEIPQRRIQVGGTSNGYFRPTGIAVLGKTLLVVDPANTAVYQIPASSGKQKPIVTITGPFADPGAVIVGP